MTLREAYERNYEQIGADVAAHWRKTGGNPFQTPEALKAHEDGTAALIHSYLTEGSSILDAGCGIGDLMLRLAAYEVQGCDISTPLLEVARERGLTVTRAFIEELPFADETFDCVVTCDVLEHVLDLNAALRELLRVLKPAGLFVMRVPNEEDLSQYLAPVPYEFIHLRRFDPGSTRIFLSKVFGLQIAEMKIVNICLNVVAWK